MPFAEIDGISTRYEVMGDGPPLLMFSPGGFDARIEKWSDLGVYKWVRLLDHLPKHYTCIVFDRRGNGQAPGRVERVTWDDFVAQGADLLDHPGIDRAHLLGGCMGCCPGTAFGVAHPDRILSMVLYWPVGGAAYRITRPSAVRPAPGRRGRDRDAGGGRPGAQPRQDLLGRSAWRAVGPARQ